MVISRVRGDAEQLRGRLRLGDDNIALQDSISILGVEVDSRLLFDKHLEKVAKNASLKVTLLRRIKHLLSPDGLLTLYKAQVRPVMEYAPLTWMSSARCHLNLLDRVERRAKRLIHEGARHRPLQHPWRQHGQQQQQQQQHQQPPQPGAVTTVWDTLGHRRKVAALTVLHKAQVQQVPHLTDLRATWRRAERSTRTVLNNSSLLEVPRSRSSTHLRAFTATTVRLWNAFTSIVDVRQMTTQQVKVAAHRWLQQHPP